LAITLQKLEGWMRSCRGETGSLMEAKTQYDVMIKLIAAAMRLQSAMQVDCESHYKTFHEANLCSGNTPDGRTAKLPAKIVTEQRRITVGE